MSSTYGLTALMECIHQSQSAQQQNDTLMTLFESEGVSDRVASLVTGDDYSLGEDSVENDMAGNGIGYEEEKKVEKFLKTVPEDEGDENVLDDIAMETLMESLEAVM